MLDQKFIEKMKEKLEKEKTYLEKDLRELASKDKIVPGDYDAHFPDYGRREDENALEVQEYDDIRALEHRLELRLQEVNNALKQIKENKYGKCAVCGEEIGKGRLEANPAATTCIKDEKRTKT